MACHVLTAIAANTYADSIDQTLSFRVDLSASTINTQTILAFNHTVDQIITIPDLSGAPTQSDTFMVSGLSGIAQTLTGCTLVGCTINSLSAPLGVQYGGTGLNSVPVGSVLVGNGTSALSAVTIASGQLLIGRTGLNPVSGALTAGFGSKVAAASGSLAISGYAYPVITRTVFGSTFATSGVAVNFFTVTPANYTSPTGGANVIAANVMTVGSTVLIEVSGPVTITAATVTMNLTLGVSVNAAAQTNLHTGTQIALTTGTYILRIFARLTFGSAQMFGMVYATAYTTGSAIITNTLGTLSPAGATNVAATNAVNLTYTTTTVGGTMSFTPNVSTMTLNIA